MMGTLRHEDMTAALPWARLELIACLGALAVRFPLEFCWTRAEVWFGVQLVGLE